MGLPSAQRISEWGCDTVYWTALSSKSRVEKMPRMIEGWGNTSVMEKIHEICS
jgi:hypothetical protein